MPPGKYRNAIRSIVRISLDKRFPGLDKVARKEAENEIAKAIHSRFYGTKRASVALAAWRIEIGG